MYGYRRESSRVTGERKKKTDNKCPFFFINPVRFGFFLLNLIRSELVVFGGHVDFRH